jgi:hypothetical protein
VDSRTAWHTVKCLTNVSYPRIMMGGGEWEGEKERGMRRRGGGGVV